MINICIGKMLIRQWDDDEWCEFMGVNNPHEGIKKYNQEAQHGVFWHWKQREFNATYVKEITHDAFCNET